MSTVPGLPASLQHLHDQARSGELEPRREVYEALLELQHENTRKIDWHLRRRENTARRKKEVRSVLDHREALIGELESSNLIIREALTTYRPFMTSDSLGI